MDNKMEQGNELAHSKKKVLFFTFGFLFMATLLVGLVAFKFKKGDPEKVFDTVLKESKALLLKQSQSTPEDFTFFGSQFNIKTNLHSQNSELETFLNVLNKMDFDYQYAYDFDKKALDGAFGINYNGKDLIHFLLYMENKEAYIQLKNFYDQYIHIPMEEQMDTFNLEGLKNYKSDLEIVLNTLEEALLQSLKKDYFKVETEKIPYQGKTITANKNSLVLDDKNTKAILLVLMEKMKNEDFIKSMSRLIQMDENDFRTSLNEFNVDDFIKDYSGTSFISIYTKPFSHDFLGIELKENNDSIQLIEENEKAYHYFIKNDGQTKTGTVSLKIENQVYSFLLEMDDDLHGSIQIDFSYQTEGTITKEKITPIIELEDFINEDLNALLEKFMSHETFQNFILENASLFGDLNQLFEFIPNQA
ncbi:MAG: hypothetical protein HFJ02_02200 [Bacilli bacterium]|nr:hypothetical protein [Bacilli bacterium]